MRALDAVDEVIIVDTGSQDNTRAASELTPKVYDFEWIDDFAAARNYAFSLASCDYNVAGRDDVIGRRRARQTACVCQKLRRWTGCRNDEALPSHLMRQAT